LSSAYLRLAIAAVALGVETALSVYPMRGDGKIGLLIDCLGAASLFTLLVPLLWRGRGVWLPLLLLGAEYVTAEASGQVGAGSVIAYSIGLIVLCELLFWFAELPRAASVDAAAIGGRLFLLVSIGAAAASLSLVALFATSVRLGSALAGLLLGAFAAAALLAIPLRLIRRHGRG